MIFFLPKLISHDLQFALWKRENEMAIPAAAAELQATMEEPLEAGVPAVAEKEAERAKEDKNKRPATAAHPPSAKVPVWSPSFAIWSMYSVVGLDLTGFGLLFCK
jgi:hypothetical protein